MSKQCPKVVQDQIVEQLTSGLESKTEEEMDEFEDLYNELDAKHKREVDSAIREFANNAIGSEYWDSDEW